MNTTPQQAHTLTTTMKVGLALTTLLGLSDVAGLVDLRPSDGEIGPPWSVVLLGVVLGVVTLVCVIVFWRTRSRGAVRLAAGAQVLSAITALPAFFAGPPMPLVVAAAVSVIVTVVAVVLLLTPASRDRSALRPPAGSSDSGLPS